LIDLCFVDEKIRKQYTCQSCPKQQQEIRRCHEPGFQNYKKSKAIDDIGLKLNFCPGKATWYPEIAEVYMQCYVAYKTGILPQAGALDEQHALFCDVFPTFIERYDARRYHRVWRDVNEYAPKIIEALAKMMGAKLVR
jgi:hypothetical protein